MKYQYIAFAGLAAAAPAMEKRQGSKYCFVFARGSTEPSPIGILIGPSLKSSLASKLPGLQTFPVGYDASIGTNVSADRTDQKSKNAGVAAFQKAAGCQVIVAGGYSQGAAVMHNVVGTVNGKKSALPENIRNKIAGVALFGDTRNKQDGGHIKDFPTERSKVWCNASDGVCGGALNVNAGHLSYSNTQINEAATYLANLAKSFKGGSSGGGDSGESSSEAAPKKSKKSGKGKTSKPPPAEAAPAPAAEAPAAAEEAPAAAEEAPAAEAPAEEAPKPAKKGKTAKAASGSAGHSHGSKWVNVPAASAEDTPLIVDESVANVVLDESMLDDGSVYAGVADISS